LNKDDETGQIRLLIDIAQKYNLRGWALFPDSDKGAALIARHYDELAEYYRLTTPAWDVLQWAVNKHLTYQLAAEIGVGFPKAFYPKNRADVETLDGKFPMILKPTHHLGNDEFSNGRGWQANDRVELLLLYDEMCGMVDPSVIMIQEMLMAGAGTQFSYAALCKEGRVLADVFAERIRLTPPQFGVSAYVESIERPEIESPSKKFLEKINYTGIVEIEFMLDKRDGSYKMLDVNTRAWGWIAMCGYAGVDFPYLLWKVIQGEDITLVRARPGVGWSRTFYDIEEALKMIWKGESFSIGKFTASIIRAHHEMYVWDDLKPALVESFQLSARVFRKLKKLMLGRPKN
jgi:predicted ATP-grasp superfamily ATP-dependent carboligase